MFNGLTQKTINIFPLHNYKKWIFLGFFSIRLPSNQYSVNVTSFWSYHFSFTCLKCPHLCFLWMWFRISLSVLTWWTRSKSSFEAHLYTSHQDGCIFKSSKVFVIHSHIPHSIFSLCKFPICTSIVNWDSPMNSQSNYLCVLKQLQEDRNPSNSSRVFF